MEVRTKSGIVSAYGFKCGHTANYTKIMGSVIMWQEHGVYHVRKVEDAHKYESWSDSCVASDGKTLNPKVWLTTHSLKSARGFFMAFCKDIDEL